MCLDLYRVTVGRPYQVFLEIGLIYLGVKFEVILVNFDCAYALSPL